MSATIGKGPERSPGLQPFSYAEAAKGRTAPIPSPQLPVEPPAKTPANSTEERRPSAHAISTTNGIESSQSTNIQEDTSKAVESSHEPEGPQSLSEHDSTSTTASTITSPALQTKTTQEPKRATSGTSSPSFGTASTSTLPKEDDISFTPNGSSDSTWDKQSQVSNSAEKSTQTGETSEEKASEGTWETTATGFKELKAAPIPSVNIWAQRKAAQDAKAKGTVKPVPAPLSIGTSTKSGSPNLPPTSDDPTPDQIKPGFKKRGSVPPKSTEEASTQQRQERRRATDGGKPRDDGSKRAGARPSRSPPEKDKATAETNPPPPVGDAESWPTPNLAQDGMKRKVSDRMDRNDSTEKEKSPGTRPHGKEKWVPVPYVPTAIFATPLPTGARRGGRGGGRGGREGGGRGGHAPSNSIGGDKAAGAGAMGPPPTPKSTSNERGRNEGSGSRATSLPAQARRANSADAATASDQRKTSQLVQQERSRVEARLSRNAEDLVPKSADSARFPNNVSEENGPKFRQESRTFSRANEGSNNSANQRTYDPSMRHPSLPNSNDIHAHPRYEEGGRRSSSFIRPSDFQREAREPNSGIYPRERGEPRTERGRGGYRGPRGNFNGGNSQPRDTFSNAQQPQQTPPSLTPSKSHSYNDRPSYTDRGSQQSQSSSYSGLNQQPRIQRPNLRSQSIPTSGGYQQYPSPNGAQVAQIQTDVPPAYAYPPMYAGIMSAMPYQPYMADYSVMSMVQMQMDYYFSVDNLCKDLYLRKHMDSQGFVPLHVIANFRRIKSLTDNLEVLRMVCRGLKSLELRAGEDGIDRVRKREGWDQWILKMEDRDPSAQNDGPAETFQQHPQSPQGYIDGPDDVFSPVELHNSQVRAAIAMSPTSMQGPFPEYPNPMIPTSPFEYMNGMMHPPLSHATPEFVPNFPPLTLNEAAARDGAPLQPFPEEMVDDIMMVVKRQPGQISSPSRQPNPTGRTLSQESISDRTMGQNGSSGDGRQALSLHGDNVRSNLNELSGLDDIHSPSSQESTMLMNGTPPNLWVKEGDIPTESLDDGEYHERYGTFRPRALAERQSAAHGESPWNMNHLYEFWSHFLVNVSNSRMYKEFHSMALEDQSMRGSSDGMQYLVRFYGDTLGSPRVVLPEIAQDFIGVVKMEPKDENRPAFRKLRSILRNGAFNLKSRKIIDNLLDSELKMELEK